MYRKVSLSSFHNGEVEYFAISGSRDIEENASVIFFYSDFTSGFATTHVVVFVRHPITY